MLREIYVLLEGIEYGVLYMVAAFFGGVSLDAIFPQFDEKTSKADLVYQVVLQCLALIIVTFVIRFFVKQVPVPWHPANSVGYVPYQTSAYSGEMLMGLIYLGSQMNLVAKIDKLSKTFYKVEKKAV